MIDRLAHGEVGFMGSPKLPAHFLVRRGYFYKVNFLPRKFNHPYITG